MKVNTAGEAIVTVNVPSAGVLVPLAWSVGVKDYAPASVTVGVTFSIVWAPERSRAAPPL